MLTKAHAAFLAAILVVFGLLGWVLLDRIDRADHDKQVIAQQLLAEEKSHSDQLTALIAAQQKALDEQRAILQKQDEVLSLAITTRNANLVTQKGTDAKLPPSDLSKRWAQLAGSDPGGIRPTLTGFEVDQTAATQTVQALEDAPVLKADNDDLIKQLSDANTIIVGLDKTIDLKNQQIAEDGKVLAAQIEADKKELTAVKASARKSKLKWFVTGFVT